MYIGRLDQIIELFSLSETNNLGVLAQTYTTEGEVWAHVKTQRGTEAFEAARINARETLRILIRYRADVDVKWRLTWESQTYNIIAVDRSMRRQGELWLTAEVVGAV